MSDLLAANQPIRFEARNPRPKYRRLRAGDLFLIEQEVDEETWGKLKTMPDNAITENVLWWHDGDPEIAEEKIEPSKRRKKEPEMKGEWGKYWQAMYKHGALNHPALVQALGPPPDNKLALRGVFCVDSLTFVSPSQFEEWAALRGEAGAGLITLSRNAAAEAGA